MPILPAMPPRALKDQILKASPYAGYSERAVR